MTAKQRIGLIHIVKFLNKGQLMERIIRLNAVETLSQGGSSRMKRYDLHPQNNLAPENVSIKKVTGNKELMIEFPAKVFPLLGALTFSWRICRYLKQSRLAWLMYSSDVFITMAAV